MKPKIKTAVLICVISLNLCYLCYSQDIHFSQFYKTPLLLNPGLTGASKADMRAIVNYKDQWGSIGAPYKTYVFSYDMALFKKKFKHNYLGAGLCAFNDKAGDTELSLTQIALSVSSIVTLNINNKITAGIQGGIAQRSINNSNLEWGNQFNGEIHDPDLPSREPKYDDFAYGDFAAGITWNYWKGRYTIADNRKFMADLGIALFHLNRSKQKFYLYDTLHTKLVVHGGTFISLPNSNIAVVPTFLFLKQGPASEFNIGAMLKYTIKEQSRYTGIIKESAISFGGYYRAGDAFIPTILFEIEKYAIGISYDINSSILSSASNGYGGIEISIRYVKPNPFKYGRGTGGKPMY